MRDKHLRTKVDALEARVNLLETQDHTHQQELARTLATIQHKLNDQSRALDRLLRYSAQATGLDAFDPNPDPDAEEGVTWSA